MISSHARERPDFPATILAGSQAQSFRALADDSVRLARALRAGGLAPGDRVAILLENCVEYFTAAWAARRAELRYVPINWHLGPEEAAYILADCDAKAVLTSPRLARLAVSAESALRLSLAPPPPGFLSWPEIAAAQPATPPAQEREGIYMFYSSGTTGRPKGVLRPLPNAPFGVMRPIEASLDQAYGFRPGMVYLTPAPLYHAAPIAWSMAAQAWGGTAVVMPEFDAEAVLDAIARYGVTHAQFVPTHFVRLLQLPQEVRARYDCSSLEMVIHAAAPCPIGIKEQMLAWWGPIIHEFYSASEGGGFTAVGPQEWLARKGTVGRSTGGAIHILDEAGRDLPAGDVGTIYFEGSEPFEYHKDPGKTAEFFNDRGWGTMGDMGWVDEAGYLFLADRKSHMIISGGVNIYPQEVENLLSDHPAVADVAVIGTPNAIYGEEVKAVVQLRPEITRDAALATELIAFCRERLAAYKCPRSVDFVDELPRLPTGKLLKRDLRKRYWGEGKVQIV